MNIDYKELKDNLTVSYDKHVGDYSVIDGMFNWMRTCGVNNPNSAKVGILCVIFGTTPYVFIPEVRLEIVEYLQQYDGVGNEIH